MKSQSIPPAGDAQSRRAFLKTTATAAAAVAATGIVKTPVYGQSQAPSPGRVIGANDRIAVAYVGVGGQGMTHVRHQKTAASENNIVQAAVCDVWDKRLDAAKAYVGLTDADCFKDHRKLLERKDIDAVVVSTVDNWHAQVAIDAMEAGKHVYGEKPLGRYMEEGFAIADTIKRTGKTFQLGSQFCADPMYHKSAQWIREGKLGPLVWAQASYCRNNKNNSEWTYPVDIDLKESNCDWYRWLGKAPKIPFNPEHYFSWHKFYAYNSGILGNLLPHRFLPLMLATGNPEFPRRVACTGTRKVSTAREITDTTHLLAEFPSGLTFCVAGSTVNETGLQDMIRGRKATLSFASSANRIELTPERIFSGEDTNAIEAQSFSDPLPTASVPRLEKNWFDCIRSGKTPLANIDLALKAHAVLSLAEMSERTGFMLFFDEATRQVKTGDGKVVPAISYESNVPMSS